MKHLNVILFISLLTLVSGCNPANKQQKPESKKQIINVEKAVEHVQDAFLLSDVADDIDIIPLEFDERYVFNSIRKICTDGDDLFLTADLSVILRYNRDGKLQNSVGRLGEGPEDYLYCFGISLDPESKRVYVASGFCSENKVKSYTYSGTYTGGITVAEKGYCMLGSESDFYDYRQGLHIFRRMLPLTDGGKDIWLLQMQDTAANVLSSFYNSVDLAHIDVINENTFGWDDDFNLKYWTERSPVYSFYQDDMNFVFEGNDTIFKYDPVSRKMECEYILHTNYLHNIEKERKAVKSFEECQYLRVDDMFETAKYIFLSVEKGSACFLVRYDKEEKSACAIKNEGEIRSGGINGTYFRAVDPPGFVNDLCGGSLFYPEFKSGKEWIKVYQAEELLDSMDEIKASNVLMPDKKEKLLSVLSTLKKDDNPVLLVVKLK